MEKFNVNQHAHRPIQELEAELAQENGLLKPGAEPVPNLDFSVGRALPQKAQKGTSTAAWDISMGAVYDRKADGSYTPKFENYKTAYGNEDRLAKGQGSWEKVGRGVQRTVAKAGMYATDAIIGTAVGIFEGLDKGEFSGVWDNSFSNWVDDVNKTLDRKLAVYHTDEYNNKNILEQILSSPLTFATSDLADGLAFVGGALLPEIAMGILSGGARVPVTLAKFGGKLATASAKKVTKEASKKAVSLTRLNNATRFGAAVGEPIRTAGFLVRTSNFEASVEARHNFHDSIESYIENYERLNGRPPNRDELVKFTELAKTASNGVWGANMAILSISNMAMFGKTFGIAPKTFSGVRSVENRLLGLKPRAAKGAAGTFETIKPTVGKKIAGNAYKILSKPATEGLWEEGMQGVAGQTMQNYLKSTYDDSMGDYYDLYSAMSDGFSHTYGTKEGWKEIGLGMIIGSLGGVMQGGPIAGTFSDSYGRAVKNTNKNIQEVNTAFEQKSADIQKRARAASSANAFRNRIESGESINPTLEDSMLSLGFIQSQESLKTHEEIKNEYNTIIDNTEFSMEDEGGTPLDAEAIEEYKAKLKEDFSKTVEDYRKAKNTFSRLGLDEQTIKSTKGNAILVKDYLVAGMVMAEKASRSATELGETIEAYLGKDGIANATRFFAGLKGKQLERVNDLRKNKETLTELDTELQKLTSELAGMTDVKDPSKQAEQRRNETAEKRMLISQQILELEEEVDKATKILDKEVQAKNLNLDKDPLTFSIFDSATQNIEKLNELDGFLTVMRESGQTAEAEYLEDLLQQFKNYTDVKREMDNTILRMADNSFLTSNKFQGWLGSLVGKTFTMSDSLKEDLRKNDKKIDAQLDKLNLRSGLTAEELLKVNLEDNPNISDREKFRLETIIRLTLTLDSIGEELSTNLDTDTVEASKEVSEELPEGDTIRLKRSLNLTEEDTNNVDILDKAINDIIEVVEEVRQKVRGGQLTQSKPRTTTATTPQQEPAKKDTPKKPSSPIIKERAEELKVKLKDVQNEKASLEDLGQFLEDFVEEATKEVGADTDALLKEMESFKALVNSKSKQATKRGIRATELIDELKAEIKDNFTFANQIIDRLKKQAEDKAQLEEVEKDIKNQIDYYEGLKKQGIQTVEDIDNKIDLLKSKRKSVMSIIDRVKSVIDVAKNILNDLISTVFREGDVFLGLSNFKVKTTAEISEGIRKGENLDDYAALKKEFEESEVNLNNAIDDVSKQEQRVLDSEQRLVALEDTVTKIDRQIRFLVDLRSSFPKQQIEEVQDETTTEEVAEEVFDDSPYRIMESEDFKRMEELQDKFHKDGELEQEEQDELDRLEQAIDQWTFATGAVVEGNRLSDLIRLRSQLKSTPIATRGEAAKISPEIKASKGSFSEPKGSPNYKNAQQPSHVTAKVDKDNNIVLSGLSYEDLATVAEEDFEKVNKEGDYETLRGNTVITQATVDKLNASGKLVINPPRSGILSYAIVLQQISDGSHIPLTSNFSREGFNGSGADFKSIYGNKVGDKIEFKIDTKDDKNAELLEAYRNAETDEAKDEARENLKTFLVIRTYHESTFNGFLKAKRDTDGTKEEADLKFEEMRNSIIDSEGFLEGLLDTNIEQDLAIGEVTISQIYIGHPNFNFIDKGNGTWGVEARPITEDNAKHVKDMGYMLNGTMKTRSGKVEGKPVDTTFIKGEKVPEGQKVPFIVLEVNGKLIAYPVDVAELEKPDNAVMEQIFESGELSNEMKVEKLNKILAERGIDIKERGNAFTFQNINNQKFFSDIFGKVESLSYFYELDQWTDTSVSMEDVLTKQVLLDINLAEPFIAPKMVLDYSKMKPMPTKTKVKPNPPKGKAAKGGKKAKKAKDETKKDC